MAGLVKGETPPGTVRTAFSLPANNCYIGGMEETLEITRFQNPCEKTKAI